MEHYGKFEDKSLIKEVLVAMPAREENTLIYYRTKILGRSPQTETPMIQLQYWQLFLEETGWWSWTCQKIGKMRNSGTWYPRPVQMKNNYRYFLCISMINEVELFLRNGSQVTVGLVEKETYERAWIGYWFPGVIPPVLDLKSVISRIIAALSLSLPAVKKKLWIKKKKFKTLFLQL